MPNVPPTVSSSILKAGGGGGLIGRQEKKVLESTEELRVEQRIKSGTLKSFEFFTPVFLCCRRSDGFGIMSTDGDRDEVKARKVK